MRILLYFYVILISWTFSSLWPINPDMINSQSDFIEALHQEVKELRGQIEVLQHELGSLKKEYNLRLQLLEEKESHTQPVKPALRESESHSPPVSQSESKPQTILKAQEALKEAEALLQQGNVDKARLLLEQARTQKNPSELNLDIQYWLGEIYLNQEDYENAVQLFAEATASILAIKNKKNISVRGAEVFFKLALCLEKLNKKEEALVRLSKLISSFRKCQKIFINIWKTSRKVYLK